jgi:hypothetical protein
MADRNKELGNVDDLEVSALSDDELDSVAGGATDISTATSCMCCSGGTTQIGRSSGINE